MGADQHFLTGRYERLAALAERELELAGRGELEELAAVGEERRALVASLPAVPPASAHGSLERAARLQAQTTAALARGLRELGGELGRIERGRSTVRRYGSPALAQAKRVDHAA